jgi:transcriptional regulator with XRE-family HTH domain
MMKADHGTTISDKTISRLTDKEYRDAFVESRVRNFIAYQIKALREQRELSQSEFGDLLGGKPQSTISRLEDPDYGRMTISTLLEIAAACDAALIVRIADYPDFLASMSDVSPEALKVESYPHGMLTTGFTSPTTSAKVSTNVGGGSNVIPLALYRSAGSQSYTAASGTDRGSATPVVAATREVGEKKSA